MKPYMIIGLLALALLGAGCCNPPKTTGIGGYLEADPESDLLDVTYTNVAVIRYFNTFLLTSELTLAKPDQCKENHWHSETEVIAISGTPYTDPAPFDCGFCTISDCPQIIEFFEDDCLARRNCIL